jgi:hypothetical protein
MTGTPGLAATAQASPWTTVGFWMIAAGAAYLLLVAARAFVNPKAFAAYLGLPLADPADTGFVYVYAARSAFIGLLAVALLIRRDVSALSVFALLAVLMPVTDVILVNRANAGAGTVLRHSMVAVFLFVTSLLLWRGI